MANKITKIKDRVLQVARYKGIAYEKFCEEIGMTYGSFKGIAKDRPLNSDAIEIIITKYGDISPEWLLTGVGNMLKNKQYVDDSNIKNVSDTEQHYSKPEKPEILDNDSSIDLAALKTASKDELITMIKQLIEVNNRNSISINKMVDTADRNSITLSRLVDVLYTDASKGGITDLQSNVG